MKKVFCILLWIASAFYFFEAVIHTFGLPILEHDKIFLPTHDRYIAIMALTYAALFLLISTNPKRHQELFVLTMIGVLVSMMNAMVVAYHHWYTILFNTTGLDQNLSVIGAGVLIWYTLTWLFWWRIRA